MSRASETTERRVRHFRRFALAHVIVVALVVAVLGGWNLVIDPYSSYGLVELEGMKEHRGTNGTRRAKAATASEGGWHTILFGSSVVATGFRSDDPSLRDLRAYNFGLSGSSIVEQAGALRVALAADPPPKRVVIFLDFEFFDGQRMPREDFFQSPLNDRYSSLEHHASNLVGAQATEHSFQAFRNWRKRKLPKYDPFGHRGTSLRKRDEPWRNLFEEELELLERHRSIVYAADRLRVVEEMLDACETAGVQTHVVIPPVHRLRLLLRRQQHADAWPRWKRELTALVARHNTEHPGAHEVVLRDFAIHCRYAAEPVPEADDTTTELRWFWDGLHFQTGLGEIVLARVFGADSGEMPEFGARLLPQTIEAHLRRDEAEWRRLTNAR